MNPESLANHDHPGGAARSSTAWSPPETIQALASEETGLLAGLILSFRTDIADRLQIVRNAMVSADASVFRHQVHTIKGASTQMAADSVASVCEQIEAAGRERPISQLADMVRQLEIQVEEVCEAMVWYQRSVS